jgi:hypothetical protein
MYFPSLIPPPFFLFVISFIFFAMTWFWNLAAVFRFSNNINYPFYLVCWLLVFGFRDILLKNLDRLLVLLIYSFTAACWPKPIHATTCFSLMSLCYVDTRPFLSFFWHVLDVDCVNRSVDLMHFAVSLTRQFSSTIFLLDFAINASFLCFVVLFITF